MTDLSATDAQIGEHWDEHMRRKSTLVGTQKKLRWASSRFVQGWLNKKICGVAIKRPSRGLHQVLAKQLDGRKLPHGISIGGGVGIREMELVNEGIVERFTIYELSSVRIEEGQKLAARLGLTDRVEFVMGDGLKASAGKKYDLVHWHAALHHMFDTRAALRWSRDVLNPGGAMYLHEYVGPIRMQYTDEMLDWAMTMRAMIPSAYLTRPGLPAIDLKITRLSAAEIAAKDPSECVDSENILPGLKEVFPDALLWTLGGVGYLIALKGLISRFDETKEEDCHWLNAIMTLDDALSNRGINLRAAALAFV